MPYPWLSFALAYPKKHQRLCYPANQKNNCGPAEGLHNNRSGSLLSETAQSYSNSCYLDMEALILGQSLCL